MTVSTALTARHKRLGDHLVKIVCGAPVGCPGWLGTAIHRDALDGDRPLTKPESDTLAVVQPAGGFTVAAFRDRLLDRGDDVGDGGWVITPPRPNGGRADDPSAYRLVEPDVYQPIGPRKSQPGRQERGKGRPLPAVLSAGDRGRHNVRGLYPTAPTTIICPVCGRPQRVEVPQRDMIV